MDRLNPAKSTPGQLSMFDPTTCAVSPAATSSPASAAGPTPSTWPAGPETASAGPDPAPANRGAWRAQARVPTIRATFGQRGFHSSASAALTRSLENRLRHAMANTGSTLFRLIWKVRTTPSGRSICRLAASERRIGGSDFSSWPTTTDSDARSSRRHGYMLTGNPGTTLHDAAQLTAWPTPRAEDSEQTGPHPNRRSPDTLTSAARATWPSPQASDGEKSKGGLLSRSTGRRSNLVDKVEQAGWTTPRAGDADRGLETPATRRQRTKSPGPALTEMASWASPQARDWKGAPDAGPVDRDGKGPPLNEQARLAAWPTPN